MTTLMRHVELFGVAVIDDYERCNSMGSECQFNYYYVGMSIRLFAHYPASPRHGRR